jgi:hypothetical protein
MNQAREHDGRTEQEPQKPVAPFEVSRLCLNEMDQSVENFKKGRVSDPVDLQAFLGDE